MPETITGRDAARFPIIASCTLFGLYLFFKVTRGFLSPPPGVLSPVTHVIVVQPRVSVLTQVFSQEYINLLLSVYFFGLGVLALSHTMR